MSRILGIGAKFPTFKGEAVVSLDQGKEFATLTNADLGGKWAVVFFWPLDFTFVCPTEIAEFNRSAAAFTDRDTVLIGASADSHFTHLAWRKDHADLRELTFPMLSDYTKALTEELGILHTGDRELAGSADRGTVAGGERLTGNLDLAARDLDPGVAVGREGVGDRLGRR